MRSLFVLGASILLGLIPETRVAAAEAGRPGRIHSGVAAPGSNRREIAARSATTDVGLFDTIRPLAESVGSDALQNRPGWVKIAEDRTDHRFQGDAVLSNGRIAVVLRRNAPGAAVYSRAPAAWKRRALLVPVGPQRAQKLLSVKAIARGEEAAAVEATFQAGDAQTLGLVCEVGLETTFVKTEPRGGTRRLAVEAASRFGVIPDFYADDIVLDAVKIPVDKTFVPTENMFAQVVDGEALAVSLWDGPPQDIEIAAADTTAGRQLSRAEMGYAPRGKVYLAVLDSPGACYAGMFDKLPERTEPIAGFKLAAPVKRLEWQMPFPAQWRVDFVTASVDARLVRSREMSAPYPWPVKDGKCEGFRFIKPTYVWDWGGGQHTERSGNPDKYPSWVDFEGRGFARPVGASYAVIVYPFDRGRGTPLPALTLTDVVRQTLGVGPCQYILDADRRMTQTPGIFTCGGTDMLKKMEGRISRNQAEAEQHLSGMVIFMNAYRRRIDQYIAFRRELLAYLETQQQRHPDQASRIAAMKALLDGIPAETKTDFPKVVEQLSVEYRKTLASDDEAAKKTRAQLHPRFTAAGGAQDAILAKCHQAARLLRFQAGLTLTPDPVAAEIALEVRRRASSVLQNPMYHENKDRHQ